MASRLLMCLSAFWYLMPGSPTGIATTRTGQCCCHLETARPEGSQARMITPRASDSTCRMRNATGGYWGEPCGHGP
jgi:hypothetical protein